MKTHSQFIFLLFYFSSIYSVAQIPDFTFGPRIGFGISNFSKLPSKTGNTFALQIGLVACKKVKGNFAIEFCPQVATYGSRIYGVEQNGTTRSSAPMLYTFHDDLRIGTVEFPFLAKYSLRVEKIYLNAFAGPQICVSMFGEHSRTYDDQNYNSDHGFSGYSIKDLYDKNYAAVFGIGSEKKIGNGFLGIDVRMQYPLTASGDIELSKFYVASYTLGIAWTQ